MKLKKIRKLKKRNSGRDDRVLSNTSSPGQVGRDGLESESDFRVKYNSPRKRLRSKKSKKKRNQDDLTLQAAIYLMIPLKEKQRSKDSE